MQLHLVYFSPTHTSRTIGRSIALGCNTDNITETDLTYRHPGQPIVIQADIAIVAVPVYGGRVAETAMERLQWIKGQQTPVIPVVVYGNRDYEDALLELTDHLKIQGSVRWQQQPLSANIPTAGRICRLQADDRMLPTKPQQ